MNLHCVSTSFHFPKSFVTYSCNTINVIITHSLSCLFIFFHSFWTLWVPHLFFLPTQPHSFFSFSFHSYATESLIWLTSTIRTRPPRQTHLTPIDFIVNLSDSSFCQSSFSWVVCGILNLHVIIFVPWWFWDWSELIQTMWICRHQGIAFRSPFGHDHWGNDLT